MQIYYIHASLRPKPQRPSNMAFGAHSLRFAVAFCVFSHLQSIASVTGFSCHSDQFKCANQRCIFSSWRCDGLNDCMDNSDEVGCGARLCNETDRFKCANGRCILRVDVCDGANDCGDNSDEATDSGPRCPPVPLTCSSSDFMCSNGHCIDKRFRCDGEDDCSDNSDEQNCSHTCKSTEFRCANGRCIDAEFVCDLEDDCGDRSDERNCRKSTCDPSQFRCVESGRCVRGRYRCDGRPDCLDRSDETGCNTTSVPIPVPPPLKCRRDEKKCTDGKSCVHRNWICDGTPDCSDGSDEAGCGSVGCTAEEFGCDNQMCVPSSQRCNGVDNCGDESDERNCPTPPASFCGAGKFRCGNTETCINDTKVCDKNRDCPNGEDEKDCDIDECKTFNGHCLHQCHDTKTGYYCSCNTGYELMDDRRSCKDINECDNDIPGLCSQVCHNTKGSFKCSCLEGYVLDPDGRKCRASAPRPSVIFSNARDIRQIKTDGSEYREAVPGLQNADSLDFDFKTSSVYWIEKDENKIKRARIGENVALKVVNVLEHGLPDALKIAVDWVGRKIYWGSQGSIEVSELDGSSRRTLIAGDIMRPSSIALDPSEGRLYWTDWSDPAKIERASMDGSGREVLLSGLHIEMPLDLAIDYTTRELYWIDSKLKVIKKCDLDGRNVRVVVNRGIKKPSAVTLFEDHMYWIDDKKIFKANKFTGKNVSVLVNEAFSPRDLHIYHPQRQPDAVTPCSQDNGKCSHLCLLSSSKNFTCSCPNGFQLQMDGKTCKDVSPPSTKSSTKTSTPPFVNHTSVNNVDKQILFQEKSEPNYGLIFGLVFGVLVLILATGCVILVIAKKKRSPRLQIVYTTEPADDKVVMVDNVRNKKFDFFKGNVNRDFGNVNYEDHKNVEDDYDDDERRYIISNQADIV
ncbi:very low-density lipoprotein receptor-like isoform X2 [Montipora capricornis]|uniref:very low-density lipoprotein receptor-like isoform X2 n=1 Tax=Montipora capricornis TaxID=246305 RepID=UPI0035F16440